ncbi:hypothetical protein N9L68_03835 [bacterium]|nr:hypothetical protein [bacterium]
MIVMAAAVRDCMVLMATEIRSNRMPLGIELTMFHIHLQAIRLFGARLPRHAVRRLKKYPQSRPAKQTVPGPSPFTQQPHNS